MNFLRSIEKGLARIEGWLIITFLWIMVALTFFQVSLRTLYTHAHLKWANTLIGYIDWSEPLVRLLVLWLAFLGASLLTSDKKHIKIDILNNLLGVRMLAARELVLSIACALISAVMLKVCINYIKLEMDFGGSMFLGLPAWIGQLILPLGFFLILFRFSIIAIERFIQIVRGVPE